MIVSAEGITKRYGKVMALKNVSIQCSKGEIVGLLGKNGAGKTTLFKILFGLVTPDNGEIKIATSRPKPMGGIIEKPALYEYLSAQQNLKVFSRLQGLHFSADDITKSLQKVGLPTDRKDPVRNFSMGMKQRLGIAIALLNDPECLVLDEPFSGLDPIGIKAIRQLIVDLVEQEHIGIIVASHIVEELSKTCHRLYVINRGEIINQGETQQIIRENTHSFIIYASNIDRSEILKQYTSEIKKNNATVRIGQDKIPKLLQDLQSEGIHITSCVPEIDFDKLFDTDR